MLNNSEYNNDININNHKCKINVIYSNIDSISINIEDLITKEVFLYHKTSDEMKQFITNKAKFTNREFYDIICRSLDYNSNMYISTWSKIDNHLTLKISIIIPITSETNISYEYELEFTTIERPIYVKLNKIMEDSENQINMINMLKLQIENLNEKLQYLILNKNDEETRTKINWHRK